MREIRFRGKRLDNGEWVTGCLKHVYRNDFPPEITSWTDAEGGYYRTDPVNPNTVGQYTGLKDEDGNEIYEGDIVSKEGFSPASVMFHDLRYYPTMMSIGCSVIGNIYDNPELLDGGGQE